jgi:hypothetical protein
MNARLKHNGFLNKLLDGTKEFPPNQQQLVLESVDITTQCAIMWQMAEIPRQAVRIAQIPHATKTYHFT